MEPSSSPPSTAIVPTWRVGHAVTSSSRCSTAYRSHYVVYAATDNCIAFVDVSTEQQKSLHAEARWRHSMRLCALASPNECVSFVAGHPEKDLVCVGTDCHGLYLTSPTNPLLTEATKLPRSVTGDCTYGATFLFTEEANYLAFSSLLHSRPSEQTPHRLFLWSIDAKALVWRGAMGPLQSMCSLAYDLSIAACSAGRIGLFSVQHIANSAAGSTETPADRLTPSHRERNRLIVLSRHCSTVEELHEAEYTCCVASPVEGERVYFALTRSGLLVAFDSSAGSVVRWMDCRVPSATALCCVGKECLMVAGTIARLFQAETWEFQGKAKCQDTLVTSASAGGGVGGSDEVGATKEAREEIGAAESGTPVFTSGVSAGNGLLAIFEQGGALSLYSTEPKAGTQRINLHRISVFKPPPLAPAESTEIWYMSSSLWCWWTPQALMFLSPPGCTLIASFGRPSTCATLHPATGVVVLFDTARNALVAYGRTSGEPAEVGSATMVAGEGVLSLTSSPTGDVLYALTTSATAAGANMSSALRLSRYRCCWAETPKEGSSGCGRALLLEKIKTSSSALVPAGTHALVVYSKSDVTASQPESAADETDQVVAVQRACITALSSGAAVSGQAPVLPTYTHQDAIRQVIPCRGGLVVAGVVTSAYVQLKDKSQWLMKSLTEPSAAEGTQEKGDANVQVVATVARHRPDIVAVCRGSRLSAWQLNSGSPLLIATRVLATSVRAMCSAEGKKGAELLVWTLGCGGLDLYTLGPLQCTAPLRCDGERLLPPPKEVTRRRTVPSPSTPLAFASSPAQGPSATPRRIARTPRGLAVTGRDASKAAGARGQRRTASTGAPSSRELSDRFDKLTGFYARQKHDSQTGDHARTPRSVGLSRRSQPPIIRAAETSMSSSQVDSAPAPSHTPRDRYTETPSNPPATASLCASAVDVSDLTVDSQVFRAAVAAAHAGVDDGPCIGSGDAFSKNDGASAAFDRALASEPAMCADSPPQRRDPQFTPLPPLPNAEDVVLHTTTPSGRAKPPFGSVSLQSEERPLGDVRPCSTPNGSSCSMTTEQFAVQARHLRESLLHLKEFLEQSELSESASEASFAAATEEDLDELSTLLTTVAAQLQLRQVRRSGESVRAYNAKGSSVAGEPKATPDAYAVVATELARIQAQNARLEEQNRIILAQLRGGPH
ncbi:hypothetical protein JKF63_06345 [Porcisia hertigi]|uniref:Uncharacterized protein n=1 Tax=Porcisia hertigi TaxID=2761500 RepID=A0A836IPR9_9TRYP|nr:hypothetical protein JKF63_06345 [Porcisia hertigi]